MSRRRRKRGRGVPASQEAASTTSKYGVGTYSAFHRHEPKFVFELNGVAVYAGAKTDIPRSHEFDLILNLTGYRAQHTSKVVEGPAPFEALNKYFSTVACDEVLIDWIDNQDLPAPRDFWPSLWTLIASGGYKRVCVCCMGGHGRTGTALAILRAVFLKEPPKDAIDWVRRVVCEDCIESFKQEDSVFRAVGLEPPKHPSLSTGLVASDPWTYDYGNTGVDKEAAWIKCAICGDFKPSTVSIGGNQICVPCVKEEVKRVQEEGVGRAAAIKKALGDRVAGGAASKAGAVTGGADGKEKVLAGEGGKGKEGEAAVLGDPQEAFRLEDYEAEKKGIALPEGATCSVCNEHMIAGFRVDFVDEKGAIVCLSCHETYEQVMQDTSEQGC